MSKSEEGRCLGLCFGYRGCAVSETSSFSDSVTTSTVEANLHWEAFQFLGKLLPTVYILRRDRRHPWLAIDAAMEHHD
jgi:hypothetical protein